jgi:hypothetical protein
MPQPRRQDSITAREWNSVKQAYSDLLSLSEPRNQTSPSPQETGWKSDTASADRNHRTRYSPSRNSLSASHVQVLERIPVFRLKRNPMVILLSCEDLSLLHLPSWWTLQRTVQGRRFLGSKRLALWGLFLSIAEVFLPGIAYRRAWAYWVEQRVCVPNIPPPLRERWETEPIAVWASDFCRVSLAPECLSDGDSIAPRGGIESIFMQPQTASLRSADRGSPKA